MITLYHWPQKDLQCSAAPGEKINDENHLSGESPGTRAWSWETGISVTLDTLPPLRK